jgi:hypothetical protein
MLTLRVFLEGADGAGTSTVLRLLAAQVSIDPEYRLVGEGPAGVERVAYSSGSYDGKPIRVEVTTLHQPPAVWAGIMRRRSDAVVLVADSTPAGVAVARQRFLEMVNDLTPLAPIDQPVGALIAHQQDRPGALSPADVGTQVGAVAPMPVLATSRSLGGVQYSLAIVVRGALSLIARRDAAGHHRRRPETIDQLAAELPFVPVPVAERVAPPAPAPVPAAHPAPAHQVHSVASVASVDLSSPVPAGTATLTMDPPAASTTEVSPEPTSAALANPPAPPATRRGALSRLIASLQRSSRDSSRR